MLAENNVQARALAMASEMSNKILVDGQFRAAVSGETFDVVNPANQQVIGQAAAGTAADVDLAVAAAKAAQKGWAKLSARSRGKKLIECGAKLAEHAEEIAWLLALETGKALKTESRIEPVLVAETMNFFGGLAGELKGETVPFDPNMVTMTKREPLGVVGVIIPWNVPLLLMAYKIAPALAAGNTVVVKSAEEAPLAVLRTLEIMNEVLPKGIVNGLSGDGPTCGAPLVAHHDVAKITFTGSVETGRTIYTTAAERLIPVTLELGGKSPMIILEDADMDKVITGAIGGMRFTRQGQSCTAASRIFVHENLHDEFVVRLKAEVDKLKMGDPLAEETDIGTIISQEQFDKVRNYIRIGEETNGVDAHRCGRLPEDPAFEEGYFLQPVIFSGITNDHKLAREEIFGPVTCVIRFSDFDEVIEQANDSEFGLAATIWTRDLARALQATDRLDAGFVQVNQNLVAQPGLSYGGFKKSGIGKEASLEAMLDYFTKKKTVILNTES